MRGSTVGIDGNLDGTCQNNNFLLLVLDTFLSSVVVAPVVITYWRGTWNLSNIYVFPKYPEISFIFSTVIGTVAQTIFTFGQEYFENNFHPGKRRILYYVISRLYTYLYSIACVNLWRGGWNALDYYSGKEPVHVVVPTIVSLAVLIAMRTVRNVSSAPFAVLLDISKGYFEVPTMFKLTGTSEVSLYILDCFFSVFVIGSLVVFVWRGVWSLTDIYLFPEDGTYSALGSIIIGYAIVIVIFGLQSVMEKICGKLTGFWRIATADVYVLVSFIGTINLWRGIWNLLDIYFLPESPLLSNWITHLGSFVFLILINCSNSVLVRGVYLDGEDGGKCVVFPTFYLRLIFQEQRRRKMEKTQNNSKITTLGSICGDVEKGIKNQTGNIKNEQVPEGPPEIKTQNYINAHL